MPFGCQGKTTGPTDDIDCLGVGSGLCSGFTMRVAHTLGTGTFVLEEE